MIVDNNFAIIGMMSLYLIIACNYKKIYLNATRDETFKCLETYKKLILTSSALCILSCIFLLYITNVQPNSMLSELGFDAFIVSALLSVYSLYYLTDEQRFPNLNKQLTGLARQSMKCLFFILVLRFAIGVVIFTMYP